MNARDSVDARDRPFVSVVVPVYNDPEGVAVTVSSLVEQSYPTDRYEVLVVDNDSTDDTRDVVRRFADEHPVVTLLVEDEVQSSYAARNRGVAAAREDGDLLAFVDADMEVPPDYLADVTDSAAERGWDYLGVSVELFTQGPETAVSIWDRLYGFQERKSLEVDHFAPTNSMVVRREVVDDVGTFDERLESSGDYEFGRRVHEAGYEQAFEPDIVLRHPARRTLRAFVKKYLRVGRGYAQLSRLHPEVFDQPPVWDPRHFLPPNPVSFRRFVRARSEDGIGTGTALAVFLVLWLQKLVLVAGRLSERGEPRTTGSDDGVVA
jgi:glycosyltransferase involved in cell wall biosynthesis